METEPPQLEILPSRASEFGVRPEMPWYRSRRLVVFSLVFVVCALLGLGYNFSRSAIYRSSASLLTVAPPEVDQPSGEADVQHVAIQRQLLLGQPLIEATRSKLTGQGAGNTVPTVADIRSMVTVIAEPETHLVELRAEGPSRALLPALVNTWIDAYLEARAEAVRVATETTSGALREQFAALGKKIEDKRAELDQFRRAHDILSMGRDENEVLARLKGLNASLNKVSEEEVTAKARLDAARAAVARGEPVVPEGDRASLVHLERRAQQLREQLTELDRRYTRKYMALQPSLKVIPEQLAQVEEEIREKIRYGKGIVLVEAEQDYAAARQAVREIQKQIEAHKQEASEFTTRFAEHEALQEELTQLEELYRDTQERLVQIEVKQQEKYPQVDVLEWAYLSHSPIHPSYLRDAVIVVVGSLLLGLLAVWLSEFLVRGNRREPMFSFSGIHLYADREQQRMPAMDHTPQLDHQFVGALEEGFPRELSGSEIGTLLEAADEKGKQLIALLLGGLSMEEAIRLKAEDIDLVSGQIRISGPDARTLPFSPAGTAMLSNSATFPAWQSAQASGRADLEALITCAAIDSGLPQPDDITAEALRHTYAAYLVRQGIRLSELPQIIGELPATILAKYGRLSPAGRGVTVDAVDLVYPVLR